MRIVWGALASKGILVFYLNMQPYLKLSGFLPMFIQKTHMIQNISSQNHKYTFCYEYELNDFH